MEVTSDILDLLDQPRFDNSIESYQFVNYEPASQNNLNNRSTPIVIDINVDDKYSHPASSYLYMLQSMLVISQYWYCLKSSGNSRIV